MVVKRPVGCESWVLAIKEEIASGIKKYEENGWKWNWREKKEQVVWWCGMYRPKCQFRTINDINGCVPCPHGLCDSLGNRILRTWTVATRCSLTAKHFDNLTWLSWQVLRCRIPSSSDLVFIYKYLCTHVIDYCRIEYWLIDWCCLCWKVLDSNREESKGKCNGVEPDNISGKMVRIFKVWCRCWS